MCSPMTYRRPGLLALMTCLLLGLVGGPATGEARDGWVVGETHRLKPGVFYRVFAREAPVQPARIGLLQVAADRELAASFEYGDRVARFAPLVAVVEQRMAAARGLQLLASDALPAAGAPRVYVGSATGDLAPPEAGQSASAADRFAPMVLHLERPTRSWQTAARELMAGNHFTHLLLVRISVSQYPKGRRGLFAKNLLLGTGHEIPVRFLTAEDKPMEVLQLSGLLIGADGRVLVAGAEGALARDTPFPAQSLELASLLDDTTLDAALTTERRADLPGAPLSLDVAADTLVGQLLSRLPGSVD